MGRRRKARERALQILFEIEFNDNIGFREVAAEYWSHSRVGPGIREYTEWLISKIAENREEIDKLIQSVSKRWRLDRMAAVDRNILRLAVCELLYEPAMAPAIIINEAVEVAKRYGGENSSDFINGVLDAVCKIVRK